MTTLVPDEAGHLRAEVARTLDLPPDELDPDEDLFSLGLDSLSLIQLVTTWRSQGIDATFDELAEQPTLRRWEALRAAWDGSAEPARPPGDCAVRIGVEPASQDGDTERFDLATMAHAYWIGRQTGQPFGGVAAHFYTELDGAAVDPDRLHTAVADLVSRHGMLRARVTDDGQGWIAPPPTDVALPVRDLRDLPPAEVDRRLADLREHYTHRAMDLAAGEVLEIALTLLPGGATRLHIDLDMVVADALSMRILLEDLRRHYEAPDQPLPPITYGYPRYLAERRARRAPERDRARLWWRERLADLPGPPELPLRPDAGRPGTPARSTRLDHWIDADRRQRLIRRARVRGITPAAALATVFAEVVGAWSRTPRFLLNLPLFDREALHPDVDSLVGDFSSSVLVDVDVSTPLPFVARARTVQSTLAATIARGAYGGVEVLRDLSRQAGAPVLAPVVYTSALGLGDIYTDAVQRCFGRPAWIISQGPQVWLDAQVTEHDGGLLLNWDVRVDSLFPGAVDAAFGAYRHLVDKLIDDDAAWDRPVGPLVPAQAARARAQVNTTDVDRPARTLHGAVFARAQTDPDQVAIIDGDRCTSYGELAGAALRVAALLTERGVRPGDAVTVTLPRGTGQVVAVLGVLAAGAAYLPVGLDQPAIRRAAIHARSAAVIALTDDDHLAAVTAAGGPTPVLLGDARTRAPLTAPVPVDPASLAYILFTSGSTGQPKGVEVSHAAATNTIDALNARLGVDREDRALTVSALDFDLSVYDMFGLLGAGGALVLVGEQHRRDPHAWWRAVTEHKVTIWNTVPALLDMLLTAAEQSGTPPRDAGRPLPRAVLLGGDQIGLDLPARLRALVPQARFVALGGMTEAAIHSTWFEVGPARDAEVPGWTAMPWGVPLDNVRARVVDPRGRDCPDWVTGELWIGGAGVARGYRGDPQRSADRFIRHDGLRWYRGGDLARYRPDGVLEFVGRADHQVKVRGHRIELGEIEAAAGTHPQVGHAAATVLEAATRRIGLVVCPPDPAGLDALTEVVEAGELADWLRDRLPAAMRPDHLVVLPNLPLSGNGKLDRSALATELTARVDGRPAGTDPPRSDVERALAVIWSNLLGVDTVDRTDSFFTLGGDSLLATTLLGRLRAAGLAGARLADLFATPTLASFAAGLQFVDPAEAPTAKDADDLDCAGSAPRAEDASAIRPLVADEDRRHEPFPPTDVQRAYWVGRDSRLPLGGVGTWHYSEFDAAEVDLDLGRLERAWNILVARHEMLRAVFDEDGHQRILPTTPPVRIDLTDVTDNEAQVALAQARADRSHRQVDLTRWPLFEVGAVRYRTGGRTRLRLTVGLDYIVFDALSIMTLFTELDRIYHTPDGQDPALPPVQVSFRDYVTQVRPEAHAVEADQAHWRKRLADLPPAPRLPTALDPAQISSPRFTRQQHWLPPASWNALRNCARAHGLTPSTVLLAAYAEVLGAWSDSPDLTVILTLFNRQDVHPHIHRILGDFTTLSLADYRPDMDGNWLAAAADLQRRLGADLDHRDVSPTWLLRELARATGGMQTMPVVFTSAIGVGDGVSMDLSDGFPEQVHGISTAPQVCLDNQVLSVRGGLQVSWDSVEGLLRPGVCEAMFDAYIHLLAWLADHDWSAPPPDPFPVSQRAVRDRVNATAVDRPPQLLHAAAFAAAQRAPERTALVWETDGATRSMSYGELGERALRLAAALVEDGVEPGEPVAVTLPKGPHQVVAVLGVLAAGGCYVPIGVEQPALRRAAMCQQAGIRFLVGDPATAGHGPGPRLVTARRAQEHAPLAAPVAVDPDSPAYVIFTSGSTGTPKGVEISHDAAANTVADVTGRFGLGDDDRVLALSALDFDLSVFDLFGLLGVGGALVLPAEEERRDAGRWLALARAHGVTVWNTVPTLLEMLLIAAEEDTAPIGLRLALVSGDWVGLDLPDRLREREERRCRLVALGGATEASIWSNAFETAGGTGPDWRSVPYGFPLENQRYRVVDGRGRDRPDWASGELWIGGRGVARGYRGDPGRTAERFVNESGCRWYRTGDLGRYRPDGTLEFLGRMDHQVKIGGHRLELAEIEAALEAFPDTRRAAVVAVGEPRRRSLHAFLERRAAAAPREDTAAADDRTLTRARTFLAERLPAYAIPPRLTLLDALPLTANGKVDRAVLNQLDATRGDSSATPPTGPLESVVAALWRDLLGTEVLDRDANFFVLGGDSILALRLVGRLRARFGVEIAIRRFLAAPTVERLAAELGELGVGTDDGDYEEGAL
ncbi:non-ribosomal peptide synthetase [Protofrankia symbiont of Coriaria ruscifolia]|uniref:non-ribosomal peptide synthetase n=1 Tax=Protofrankia symbiont of Coriaria ruscifolia TaxID=1306542 RepID=UPI001A95423A|nr:non-ribosomal peptide synthetase [Protofrankia symbiont of Coriaria ruscifolia]